MDKAAGIVIIGLDCLESLILEETDSTVIKDFTSGDLTKKLGVYIVNNSNLVMNNGTFKISASTGKTAETIIFPKETDLWER